MFYSLNQTLYEHYATGGIEIGLEVTNEQFMLNNKPIFIRSGSIHYFRIPNVYWRDRLRKLRAAGFNTVDTLVSFDSVAYLTIRF